MNNIQQIKQAGLLNNLGNRIAEGRVVDNKDPQQLGRVRVEIQGKTDGAKPEDLPWLDLMLPLFLGGSAYTSNFAIPQVNTQVVVMFIDDNMSSGYVIGSKLNRISKPYDPLGLSEGYKHPKASKHVFSKVWDSKQENQTSFSMDMSEDLTYSWGWVDHARNWFKINTLKRTVEFVANCLNKIKMYANGDTVVHITGNLKLIIEKDLYIETRGNADVIINGCKYEYIGKNNISETSGYILRKADGVITDQGDKIFAN